MAIKVTSLPSPALDSQVLICSVFATTLRCSGHRALGDAGGPAGVLEQGHVVGADVELAGGRPACTGEQILHPDVAGRQLDPVTRLSSPWSA